MILVGSESAANKLYRGAKPRKLPPWSPPVVARQDAIILYHPTMFLSQILKTNAFNLFII